MNARHLVPWLLPFLAFNAEAATRYVGACGAPNTPTLNAAIAAASAGDSILICPGTYNEAVNVNKDSLTIRSSTGNRADVTLSNNGIPLTLTGQSLTIRDLSIDSSNDRGISRPWTSTPSPHVFENLAITAKKEALYVYTSRALTLRNLTVESRNSSGIYLDGAANGAHVLENIMVSDAKEYGIYIHLGAASLRTIQVSSQNKAALQVASQQATTFDNITVYSQNDRGIYVPWGGATLPMTFSNITVSEAKENGIQVDQSGKLTFDQVTVTSRNADAINLGWGAAGEHSLNNLDLSANNGHGLYAAYGLGSVGDFKIVAKNYGINTISRYPLTIRRGSIDSRNGSGIKVDSYVAAAHTISDVKVVAKDIGVHLTNALNADLQRVCVDGADEGIRADWSASNTSIRDSRFTNYKDYGVNVLASEHQKATIANNCFMKSRTPRANSNSILHLFNGNYWEGVAGGTSYSDGSVRDGATLAACPVSSCYGDPDATAIGYWRLEESAWNGTAGEVKDSSGNNRHGVTLGSPKPTPVTTAPARAGNPGTCGYGSFPGPIGNGGAIEFTGLPVSTAAGARTTVSFWMYWNGGNNMMPIGWNTHDLWLISGNFGFNTGNSDVFGIASAGLANRWAHVVAVFTNGSVTGNTLYIDGVRQTLTQRQSTPNIRTATVQSTLRVSGWQRDTSYRFIGRIDEVKVYNGDLSQAQVTALYNETHPCGVTSAVPTALNAVDVGANPVTGQITTKSAGVAFSLDIYALSAARAAYDTAASGDVLVDLLANTGTGVVLGADNCPATATSLAVGTVTLASGRATASVGAVADSWRDVRVRMRYPATGTATVTACSSDNFAVKPAVLTAIASQADWQTAGTTTTLANTAASGGVVHKAGQPFTLRVTGYNAGNVVTGNYDGSPAATATCVLPASGCVAGGLDTGGFSAASGTLTSHTARFSEVGAVSASFVDSDYASVDSDDTAASCAGFHACTTSAIDIGRFVPDHYEVVSIQTPLFQTFGAACANRSFTYVGQEFGFSALPRARITAKNAADGTTANAKGSLWKLSPNGHFASSWGCQKTGGASCGTVSITAAGFSAENLIANNDGSGDFTWPANALAPAGVKYKFERSNPASSPFNAELGLGILILDSSEAGNCGLASCLIRDTQAVGTRTWGNSIAFDAGNEFRQGRLRLVNASGSELLPLPLPLTAQYWNGQGWVGNAADNCTTISSPTLTFFSQSADNRLASGETTASFNATLVSGHGDLRFTAPGAGNFGFMDVSVAAPAWLKFNWDGTDQGGDGDLLDDHPRARATFGKRRGSDRVIIRREMY